MDLRPQTLRGLFAASVLSAVACGCAPSPAQPWDGSVYRWTDSGGSQHYSHRAEDVPRGARGSLERLTAPDRIPPEPAATPGPAVETPAPPVETAAPEAGAGELAPLEAAEHPAPEPPQEPPQAEAPTPPEPPQAAAEPSPSPVSAGPASSRPHPDASPALYAVQLRALGPGESGKALPEVALASGERLYTSALERDGQRWQRLRVGFFESEAAARRRAQELAERFPGAWVARVDAAERNAAEAAPARAGGGTAPPTGSSEPAARSQSTPPPQPAAAQVPASGDGAYVVQLFTRQEGERLGSVPVHALFRSKTLYVLPAQVEGKASRRLRLGFFSSESEAQEALSELHEGFPEARVERADAAEVSLAAQRRILPPETPPASSQAAPVESAAPPGAPQ